MHCSLWTDNDLFCALTPSAQRMYLFLFTQPTINLCGVLAITAERWARRAKGLTAKSVKASLLELSSLELVGGEVNEPFIVIDWETEEVWVRSFVKNDHVCSNEKTRKAAFGQLAGIASPHLRALARSELDKQQASLDASAIPSDGLSDAPSDRDRERARASSNLLLQPPVSTSSSAGADAPRQPLVVQNEEDEVATQQSPRGSQILHMASRLAGICVDTDRATVTLESFDMVTWASECFDSKVIDQAIGEAAKWSPPPGLPRAVAKVLLGRSRGRLKPFQPKDRKARNGSGDSPKRVLATT